WLRAFRRTVDAVNPVALTPDQRVDRRILQGILDGWLLDLDRVRTWTRNPMIYASAISDGLHNLMTMESSPASLRVAQMTTKLQAVPRLLSSARENVSNPPRVFSERAIVIFRGIVELLTRDMPLAFAEVTDRSLLEPLRSAASNAERSVQEYARELQHALP